MPELGRCTVEVAIMGKSLWGPKQVIVVDDAKVNELIKRIKNATYFFRVSYLMNEEQFSVSNMQMEGIIRAAQIAIDKENGFGSCAKSGIYAQDLLEQIVDVRVRQLSQQNKEEWAKLKSQQK